MNELEKKGLDAKKTLISTGRFSNSKKIQQPKESPEQALKLSKEEIKPESIRRFTNTKKKDKEQQKEPQREQKEAPKGAFDNLNSKFFQKQSSPRNEDSYSAFSGMKRWPREEQKTEKSAFVQKPKWFGKREPEETKKDFKPRRVFREKKTVEEQDGFTKIISK